MSVKTANGFFQYVDKNFGLGGVANYAPGTIKALQEFIRIISSDQFANAERASLIKILQVYNKLDIGEKYRIQDEIGG